MKEKPRLGRGLDALIGSGEPPPPPAPPQQAVVSVLLIEQNPYQPRKAFDEGELSGLRDSIRTHGVLQPLVVRSVGDRYQLIAGERRLRAAQAVGLDEVPVRVVNFNDQEVLEAALAENIHRTDLNPIEKAQGFKEHLDRFGLTQEELAGRLGVNRTTISNLVNLLELEPEVQDAVRVNSISEGHAKILKGIKDRDRQLALCREIIARGYSVHATQALVKQQNAEREANGNGPPRADAEKSVPEKTAHIRAIEDELRQKLAMKVEIRLRARDKGQVVFSFDSNDDFETLLEVLRK